MLNDRERSALEQWYAQKSILETAQRLYDNGEDEELEEHLHMLCLLPLSRHDELPGYIRTDDGGPLFPTNLNPAADLEKWQDAIEVGWKIVERELGITHDQIHRRIADTQNRVWNDFLERAERRRKERS